MRRITIISGAQTGVDRAALDAAIACGLVYGGAIPCGRLSEDGPVSKRYTALVELKTNVYAARTRRNVLDADATLILCPGPPEGGTALTQRLASSHEKPVLVIDLDCETNGSAIKLIRAWIEANDPAVLNVAGPRESRFPGLYDRARKLLEKLFREISAKTQRR
ncbi:MAG: molybdenum cofactor carrier [Deltaproteobacteria bacterium]|nr:molybdenum cofactor carrier [Deltaproteobacteria bacterium]